MKDIKVSIRDLRAVKSADIELNGITILSGVNSSGKSTISRLLYYTFKSANEFDKVVEETFSEQLAPLNTLATRIAIEFRTKEDDELRRLFRIYRNSNERSQESETLIAILQKGKELLASSSNNHNLQYQQRYISIIKNILDIEDNSDNTIDELFDRVIDFTKHIYNHIEEATEERKYQYLKKYIEEKIGDSLDNITIEEYGFPLIGKTVQNVPIMEYVQQVAYIDTPVIVGLEDTFMSVDYWEDLDALLQHPTKNNIKNRDINISEQIRGEALYEDNSIKSTLIYKRNDGKVFNLWESATGIKSFSIIQILLNNGFINKNSLIIIDEPEAHLHPQWIVEYARMIVLLHKQVGAKFFIASHSTDFVSAIKYIATKEECLPALSYYLSEEDAEAPFTYNYRSLGQDIEPIFESFNKSFELIDKYGTDND